MGWWQTRKARKQLEALGLNKTYLDEINHELKQGYKKAKNARSELRGLESPAYHKSIKILNQIAASDAPQIQKEEESFNLVISESDLSEFEKTDLLRQLNGLYGESLTPEQELERVINALERIKQGTGTPDEKLNEVVKLVCKSFIPYGTKADLILEASDDYSSTDSSKH